MLTSDIFEQGYNTSFRPLEFNENTSPSFTHDLLLSDVPIVVVDIDQNGTDEFAYEFQLDINETKASTITSKLSLHTVEIYTTTTPGDVTGYPFTGFADLKYDMDAGANNILHLDYALEEGSGKADMFLYIPIDVLGFPPGDTRVILYSEFGATTELSDPAYDPDVNGYDQDDGFEEWAVRQAGQLGGLSGV